MTDCRNAVGDTILELPTFPAVPPQSGRAFNIYGWQGFDVGAFDEIATRLRLNALQGVDRGVLSTGIMTGARHDGAVAD